MDLQLTRTYLHGNSKFTSIFAFEVPLVHLSKRTLTKTPEETLVYIYSDLTENHAVLASAAEKDEEY
jgi:hypothetical protein